MNPDYTQALNFSYGPATLELWDYEVTETPVVKQGLGRVYTTVVVRCECYLSSSVGTPADFAAQVALTFASLRIDGQDLIITGLGGNPEYVFLAAQCLDGGPHITIHESSDDSPMCKRFELSATAQWFGPQTGPKNSYQVRTQTRPDGVQTVTWGGQVIGPNSAAYFLGSILPKARTAYPLPGWVQQFQFTASQDGNLSKTEYSIESRQNFDDLPDDGNGDTAVDGEITVAKSRDAQHQVTTDFSIDLLVTGDAAALMQMLRAQYAAQMNVPAPMTEQWRLSTVKENRITASFRFLGSGDASPLLEWTTTVSLKGAGGEDGSEIKTYPGAAPIVIHRPASLPKISQSITATAVGKWKKPTPLFTSFLSEPEESYTDVNDVVKQTTAHYEMYPTLGNAAGDGGTGTVTVPVIGPNGNGGGNGGVGAAIAAPNQGFTAVNIVFKNLLRANQDDSYYS